MILFRNRKERASSLTGPFALVSITYFMSACAIISYAAVYLQELGFDNFTLGVIIAVSSILASLLGPALASYLDRRPEMGTASMNYPLFAGMFCTLAILMLRAERDLFTAVVFVLLWVFSMSVYSVNMRFCGDAARMGMSLNYGIARGLGSCMFIIPCVVLGQVFTRRSPRLMPFVAVFFVLLQTGANLLIGRTLKGRAAVLKGREEKGDSLLRFLRNEPRFALLLLGNVLIFFAFQCEETFRINLVRNVGGDAGTMGVLTGYTAALEIPALFAYSLLRRRWRSSTLLRASYLFFSLKALALAIASSVTGLYLANLLQPVSYALYCSAIVDYVLKTIPGKNSTKAQSLAYTVCVVANVLASVILGRLFDVCTVRTTMFICFAVSAAGTVLSIAAVKRTD